MKKHERRKKSKGKRKKSEKRRKKEGKKSTEKVLMTLENEEHTYIPQRNQIKGENKNKQNNERKQKTPPIRCSHREGNKQHTTRGINSWLERY